MFVPRRVSRECSFAQPGLDQSPLARARGVAEARATSPRPWRAARSPRELTSWVGIAGASCASCGAGKIPRIGARVLAVQDGPPPSGC